MRHANDTHPLVLRAEAIHLSREAVESLSREIPGEAKAVDRLLEECSEGHFARAFTALSLAALHAGVAVDARHLVRGARLVPDPILIGKLSTRMEGDVPERSSGRSRMTACRAARVGGALLCAASRERAPRPAQGDRPPGACRARARLRGGGPAGAASACSRTTSSARSSNGSPRSACRSLATGRPVPGRPRALLEGLADDDAGVATTRRRAAPRGTQRPCCQAARRPGCGEDGTRRCATPPTSRRDPRRAALTSNTTWSGPAHAPRANGSIRGSIPRATASSSTSSSATRSGRPAPVLRRWERSRVGYVCDAATAQSAREDRDSGAFSRGSFERGVLGHERMLREAP
jgi:hypothetical protein